MKDLKLTAAKLKEIIRARIKAQPPIPENSSCPRTVYVIAEYLNKMSPLLRKDSNTVLQSSRFSANNKKIAFWKANFAPGSFLFRIPPDDRKEGHLPDRLYHSVENSEIYMARWELAAPERTLTCPRDCCDGELIHKEMKISRSMTCTKIFSVDADQTIHRYAFSMQYQCKACSSTCRATDGNLLRTLPFFLQKAYPVDPRQAKEGVKYHFYKTTSKLFSGLGTTYLSAEAMSKYLYQNLGECYLECEVDYYSQFLVSTSTRLRRMERKGTSVVWS